MSIAVALVTVMLVEIIALHAIGNTVVGAVKNPANTKAVEFIFSTVTGGLQNLMIWSIVLSAVVLILVFISSSNRIAKKIRSFIWLDRVHGLKSNTRLMRVQEWMKRFQGYIYLAVILAGLIFLAINSKVSAAIAINTLAVILIAIGIIRLFVSQTTYITSD
jgi:hypothetical protein